MSLIAENSNIVTKDVARQARVKIDAVNFAYIRSHNLIKPESWVDNLAIMSDNVALRIAISGAVSRLPFILRISQGYDLGKLAQNEIDGSKIKGVHFTPAEHYVIDTASSNKVSKLHEAIQHLAGKLALAIISDKDRSLHVIKEDELRPGSLVVPVRYLTTYQEDKPGVLKVISTPKKYEGGFIDPLKVRLNGGEGLLVSFWQKRINEHGFLTEEDAKRVTTDSRLLALKCLPGFIKEFQRLSPMYKK